MPLISRLGAASSRGFGQLATQASGKYIEDYFSTYLYTGNNADNTLNNGIGLSDTLSWTTLKIRQTSSSLARSVAVDSSGNFYVGGTAYDGQNYILVAKFDSTGTLQWQRKIRQNASSAGFVSFDSSGNVYVVGTANNGTSNYALIAKYDSSGTIQWQRKLSHTSTDSFTPFGIFVDSSSNVYVAGTFGSLTYSVVAKYNSSGVIQWQRRFNVGAVTQNGYGVSTDSSGNVYLVGGNAGFSINKYNSSGAIQWQRVISPSVGSGRAVTVDSSNNIYVTGQNADKILLAKYNDAGVIQWQRTLVDAVSSANVGTGITTDSSGNVYLVGRLGDTFSGYACVAKYNSSGTLQWQRKIRQSGSYGYGISINSSGALLVALSANDGTNYGAVIKMTTDGDLTSGAAFVDMLPGTATSATSAESEAANTGTDGAGPAVDAAGTATDSAGTATVSSATQAAVTGAGGFVWIKGRSGATDHALYDTVRGATKDLVSNSTAAQTTQATGLTSFFASGFTIGPLAKINSSGGATYASWTFRKAPKFFDCLTYTGNGSTTRSISHNLGSVPGFVVVKRTDSTGNWITSAYDGTSYKILRLNTTAAAFDTYSASLWTSSTFRVANYGTLTPTGSTNDDININGATYVAYLFAHDAGGFGADGSQNVISCGSYVGNGSATGPTITLGWEPQFLLVKSSTEAASNWFMFDTMRGLTATASAANLSPNSANAEGSSPRFSINATGFSPSSASTQTNTNGQTYIYMAIRRGPMRVPTDATKVFNPYYRSGSAGSTIQIPSTALSYPPDTYLGFVAYSGSTYPKYFVSRLADQWSLQSDSTAVEQFGPSNPLVTISGFQGKVQVGAAGVVNSTGTEIVDMYLGRAPSFFDAVCYTGTSGDRTLSHNLGVAPQLSIVKTRSTTGDWSVTVDLRASDNFEKNGIFNTTAAFSNGLIVYGNNSSDVDINSSFNQSGVNYILYLFASCPGVSKVGTYTGTGTTNQINCGFTAGARFVLIKRTDSTGGWYFWNSATGIATGNDPYMFLNSNAQITPSTDYIDPYAAGFEISSTAPAGVNANGGTYIFLAIA